MIKIWRWSSLYLSSYSTFCVFGFGPLVAKPRIRLDWNLVCDLLLPSGTYVQGFGSIAPAVTKRTTDTTWLYRLAIGESKNFGNFTTLLKAHNIDTHLKGIETSFQVIPLFLKSCYVWASYIGFWNFLKIPSVFKGLTDGAASRVTLDSVVAIPQEWQ
jgi:hypothetical protein